MTVEEYPLDESNNCDKTLPLEEKEVYFEDVYLKQFFSGVSLILLKNAGQWKVALFISDYTLSFYSKKRENAQKLRDRLEVWLTSNTKQ